MRNPTSSPFGVVTARNTRPRPAANRHDEHLANEIVLRESMRIPQWPNRLCAYYPGVPLIVHGPRLAARSHFEFLSNGRQDSDIGTVTSKVDSDIYRRIDSDPLPVPPALCRHAGDFDVDSEPDGTVPRIWSSQPLPAGWAGKHGLPAATTMDVSQRQSHQRGGLVNVGHCGTRPRV